jgi:putative ABC transport system permease protein
MTLALSRRLPPSLLLGVRLVLRRPRRSMLSGASVLITAMTVFAVLTVHAHQAQQRATGFSTLVNPRQERIDEVLLVLTVTLAALAAVNAIVVTQAIPAVPAVLLGIPAGIGLVKEVSHGASVTVPPAWWLVLMVAGTLAALVALTAIPARASSRQPVAEILQAESA